MVQKYSFYMTAVSICSEDARIPQEQVADSGKWQQTHIVKGYLKVKRLYEGC